MRKTIDFLQLTTKLPYPVTVKGKLSTVHATMIDQFLLEFTNKHTEKLRVIHAINCVSYMYVSHDSFPANWNEQDPLHTFQNLDDDFLKDRLGTLYISAKDVDWSDVPVSENTINTNSGDSSDIMSETNQPTEPKVFTSEQNTYTAVSRLDNLSASRIAEIAESASRNYSTSPIIPTDKSDLYIQPPVVPRFDFNHPWRSGIINDTAYVIYPSYPVVPTRQNEISVTTDINKFSDADLRRLYPNCLIRTRAACMYEPYGKLILDPKLGLILPIEGYTKQQLVDNIIRYPHIFRLLKQIDYSIDSFYSTIEIDGELHRISEVWNTLPESVSIPYTKEFVKEYVVRRYLLERDIKGIDHKYKMYGTLDPYLTLFTSIGDYISMGYTDIIQMAKDCVYARIRYKQSRNPIIRGLDNNA